MRNLLKNRTFAFVMILSLVAAAAMTPARADDPFREAVETKAAAVYSPTETRYISTLPESRTKASKRRWKKAWIASWVAFAAVNLLDAHSSASRRELNPLLRNSDGTFSARKGRSHQVGPRWRIFRRPMVDRPQESAHEPLQGVYDGKRRRRCWAWGGRGPKLRSEQNRATGPDRGGTSVSEVRNGHEAVGTDLDICILVGKQRSPRGAAIDLERPPVIGPPGAQTVSPYIVRFVFSVAGNF